MKKEIFKLEFPFKLEELLNYTFNFDNLIKAISFLQSNNIELVAELNNVNKRLSLFDAMRADINEMKIQSKNLQNQNDTMNQSLKNMQERFLKFDLSINELNKKIMESGAKIQEHNINIELHEKNLNHLNKVVEDNVKKIGKLDEEISTYKKEFITINDKIEQLKIKDKDLESLILNKTELLNSRLDDNKNDIETLDNTVATLNSFYNALKNKIEIKNKEFETMIENLSEGIGGKVINITSIKKDTNKEGEDNANTGLLIKTINDNNFLSSKIKDLEEEIKNFNELINSKEKNMKERVDKNENNIKDIKNNIEQLTQDLEGIIKEVREEKEDPFKNLDLSKYVTKDVFKKANDNIRILTSALGTTTTREEFENQMRKINSRLQSIELLQQGVSYGERTMINSNLVQSGISPQEMYLTRPDNLPQKESIKYHNTEELKKLIISTINEEIKNINIIKNPKFAEILNLINLKQEIEKLSEESSKKIKELFQTINGDEADEDEEEDKKNALSGLCINKKIIVLIQRFNELYNKLTLVQNKNNSLSREIKDEVKENLKKETMKVVDEFKSKLDSFTYKFENELRSKIDQSGLSVFEDKMSSRFRVDLKEKLDKSELKKNNYVIKKKINNLENKISKTLVDTIIDLQMDEAPLIVKTNAQNVELCASCNQALKKNFLNTDRNFHRNTDLNSISNRRSFKSNSNHHINLKINTKETSSNTKSKKLPGISSYTQSK